MIVKHRFYVDVEYDPKAVPKWELQRTIKGAVKAELPDLARDFQTTLGSVVVTPEPLGTRRHRQALQDAHKRNEQWLTSY
jgi:hypothetical protein